MFAPDEQTIQPARPAGSKHIGEQLQRVMIRIAILGKVISDHHRRKRNPICDVGSSGLRLFRLDGNFPVQGRAGRDPPEEFLHHRTRRFNINVAGDDQRGVIGQVISVEKILQFIHPGRTKMVHVADRRPSVAVGRKGGLEEVLVLIAVRPVLAHAPFLGHHLSLGLVNLLGDFETGHPVRLKIKGHLEMVGRKRVVVNGLVETGEGV